MRCFSHDPAKAVRVAYGCAEFVPHQSLATTLKVAFLGGREDCWICTHPIMFAAAVQTAVDRPALLSMGCTNKEPGAAVRLFRRLRGHTVVHLGGLWFVSAALRGHKENGPILATPARRSGSSCVRG